MAGVKHYETDVAIVGAGAAGVAAGIEARDAGARAIAFEQGSALGRCRHHLRRWLPDCRLAIARGERHP